MNNDGIWEQEWTTSNEKTISYNYPNPSNGISENHTIKIEIYYSNILGQHWTRTRNYQVIVFSTPRVYVNAENYVFIQLRDENCINKIPVLLVEGFDPLNEKYPETYYNLTWDLVNNDLYPNGYEVFILNFHDGGRDLRLNADVLLKCLEKIHEICPNYQIAVGGLSMGGPITRYALAKKENQGKDHHVGLFMSYDSPQKGAHANPNLQDWIKIQDPNQGVIGILQNNLNSIAARQMLLYNTYDPNHVYHNAFYDELDALNGDGYPHKSYNVAVSNGNLDATWGYGSVGRHLMTLKVNDFLIKDVPAVPFDCGTGSLMTDITMTRYGDIFPNPFVWIYYELSIIFNPAYIPTWSALDLVNPQINTINGNITSFDRSKFDDFVMQTHPLQHHELSNETRNAILDWLDLDFNLQVAYNLINGGNLSPINNFLNILHGVLFQVSPTSIYVNGKPVDYNFLNWWDGNTSNPRKLFTSHNVTRQVFLKGHKVSNTSSAISSNSQRKMIFDGTKYHLVYEDQGEIYYTNSGDGVNWIPEERVSNGSGLNRGACIASDYSSTIAVTWQEANQILVRTRSFAGQWGQVKAVNTLLGSDSYEATPVIDYGYDSYYYIVWRHYELSSRSYDLRIVAYSNNSGNFGTIYQVPKTNNSSKNPSMISNSQGYFHLVWEENFNIYYSKFKPEKGAIPLRCFQIEKEQVSEATAWTSHMYPCITLTYNQYPNVMWQAHNGALETDLINHRRRTFSYPGGWGTTTTFTGKDQNFVKPSISGFPEIAQNYKLKSSWRSENMGLYVANFNGSSWTTNFISNPYYFEPNVMINKSTAEYCKMVYRNYNSPPYFLNVTAQHLESGNIEGGFNKMTEGADIRHHRRGIVKIGQSEIVFELGDITINGQEVQFFPVSDSLIVGQNANLNQVFRTMPFQISHQSQLTLSIGSMIIHRDSLLMNVQAGKDIKFSLNVTDAQSGQILFNLDKWSAIKNLPSDTLLTRTFTFRMRGTRNVILSVELNLSNGIWAREDLNEVYYLSENGPMLKAVSSDEKIDLISLIPGNFTLYQNYPNPFNPATTITFDLPKDVRVRLEIFDVAGRLICTLIDEPKEAGSHQVVWNGQDDTGNTVASGLYIYRLQAGDFVQSRKMLFMK